MAKACRMKMRIARFLHTASAITPIEYVLYSASMLMLIPTTARIAGVV